MKTVRHRQEEIINQKKPVLPQIKLDTGTFVPGTASIMQDLQKDETLCQSVQCQTVNRRREEKETGSNTDSWPEVDYIQSVNDVNRKDFYKAILLVEGQPIEFTIDTGTAITKIPPILNPEELQKTTKCFVQRNKVQRRGKGGS